MTGAGKAGHNDRQVVVAAATKVLTRNPASFTRCRIST